MSFGMSCPCSPCNVRRAAGMHLTGIQRTRLETLREHLPTGMANREVRPLAGDVDPDGSVRFRPASLSEQLDRIVAAWIWQTAMEGLE